MGRPKRPDSDPLDRLEFRVGKKDKMLIIDAADLEEPTWSTSKWCTEVLLREARKVLKRAARGEL